MANIVAIGEDPKLEHAGAGDDPLDEIDFRLLHLGNDHLDLIETVLPDRDLLLTARIDAATDRCDELVHRDRSRLGHDVEVNFECVIRRPPARLPHRHPVELRLAHRRQKGLAGRGIAGGKPHGDAAAGPAAEPPLSTLLGHQHSLDPPDGVVDTGCRLLRCIDLVDEDQAPLEIDAQPRRPPHRADHEASGQRDEHRGDPPPHIGGAEAAGDQPCHKRRDREREQRDAPKGPALSPPWGGHGGCRGDDGCSLRQKTECDARGTHA